MHSHKYRAPKKSGDNIRREREKREAFQAETGKRMPAVRKHRKIHGFKTHTVRNSDSMFGPDIEDFPRSGEGFTVR